VAEEGRGKNEVVQPVNPAANVAANALANPVANAPANDSANATGNVVNNATNTANFQANVAPNPRHNAGAQPPPVQANRAEVLTVDYRIKVHMDLQPDKSPVVVKGPFFPRVVNPRYRIRGTMFNARIQSSKARKAI
jgi:hypothetical protein